MEKTELKDLTKDDLMMISKIERLIDLNNECGIVNKKVQQVFSNFGLCSLKINKEMQLSFTVPNVLYSLLCAIENGELTFKKQ